jgi:hypothetical protein
VTNRLVARLTTLTLVMAIGEFVSSVVIAVENYADAQPEFAVAFGVLFLVALWLLRSGRVTAGGSLAGLLCVFEVVSYPGWPKPTTFDWVGDTIYVLVALTTLVTAIAMFVSRRRIRASA